MSALSETVILARRANYKKEVMGLAKEKKETKKRRGRGEGSIYQRKDGLWVAQATVGINPKTGKPKRKTFYGKTRREVADKLTKTLHKVQSGTYVEPTLLTVEQWLNDWLEGRKPHIEESSWVSYEVMVRCHINPTLGKVKLKDLRTRDIQKLINEKLETGLSPRSVKYIHTTLNMALKQAIRERLIAYNPVEAVELPKQRKKEMETFSQAEVQAFLQTAWRESRHYAAFHLEFLTGLRRGELLALKWEDIDFKKRTLTVREQLVRAKEGLIFKGLKTAKSRRVMPLRGDILEVLKIHRDRQAREKENLKQTLGEDAFKEIYQENDLLFCTELGKPLDPDNFVRHFKTLLKKAGLKDIRFHDLRHTFATLSLEAGVNPKALQEMLGHATFGMTMDTYGHATQGMVEDAAEIVGGMLTGIKNKPLSKA